jgi:pyruvate,water dikinase
VDGPTDPIHSGAGGTAQWSRAQMAEALPGVQTPLNWSWWGPMGESAVRNALADLHVLGQRDRAIPVDPAKRMWAIFFGRPAANLDVLRNWADRTPFLTGEALSRLFYNRSDSYAPAASVGPLQLAVVVPLQAVHAHGLPGLIRRWRATCDGWWSHVVNDTDSPTVPGLTGRLKATYRHLDGIAKPHALNNWLLSCLVHQLTRAAEGCGRADLVDEILGGYGSLEEITLASDLSEVGRGNLPVADFLAVHGYHGPAEGEMSSRSWREDPKPIVTLAERYAILDAAEHPRVAERERASRRIQAERKLLDTCPPRSRAMLAITLRLIARHLPLRQLGHNASTQMCDTARADARRLGELLSNEGVIAQDDDIFYLTVDEIMAGPSRPGLPGIDRRRQTRERYAALELPNEWTGDPEPDPSDTSTHASVLNGIGASSGVATGRARVVLDADWLDGFRPGEVLVCQTTDPSWSAAFALASAVVLDTGGRMSHGAIVAREFGLPCVTNTGRASVILRSGDLVQVDGDAGTVRRLQEAGDG